MLVDIYELAKKFNTVPTKDLYTYQTILNNPNLDPDVKKLLFKGTVLGENAQVLQFDPVKKEMKAKK